MRQHANRLNKSFLDLMSKQKQERQEPLGDKVLHDHFLARLRDDLLGRQLRERAFQNPDLTFFAVREEAICWQADDEEATSAVPIQAEARLCRLQSTLHPGDRCQLGWVGSCTLPRAGRWTPSHCVHQPIATSC